MTLFHLGELGDPEEVQGQGAEASAHAPAAGPDTRRAERSGRAILICLAIAGWALLGAALAGAGS